MKKFPRSVIFIIAFLFIFSTYTEAQISTIDFASEKQYIRGYGGVNMPDWIDDLTPNQVEYWQLL